MSASIRARTLAAAAVVLGAFAASAAHARSDVYFSIGVHAPAPAGVHVQPAPVYVPPPPHVYGPPAVRVAPGDLYVRPGPHRYGYPYAYEDERARRDAWRRWHWRRHHHQDRYWDDGHSARRHGH